ncbi:DoxX family protein [Candidatus Nomurabacteria bacterium RIFCSPLOWO2_01_FULL_46_18]|uniref:DoxX family protein n=1 Tax=Candidatus Nomurabacteria bacterium RIFCSPLOWO2_01_FULL_46_18 TaxID=1801783 RepID=A0A1F6XCC6_9BACT|nr:MAG: DoxX family protein [Candidatus Nomurabacteria bacterium RIFCSPLOWO2_01_FULL_46_18]
MIYLFLLGRVLLGGYFIMSGYNHFKNLQSYSGYAQSKGVPMPKLAVLVTGAMLALGGLGVLLGVWINLAILLLALFLIFVTPKMHAYWTITDPMMQMGERVNFYKNLALLGAVLMLLFIPTPWFMSLF